MAAVVDVHGVRLAGLPAWWFWLWVHILFLIGFRNRIIVLIQWAWAYATYQRGARLIAERTLHDTAPVFEDRRSAGKPSTMRG
jgi:NADH dehydrogenase